MGNDDLHPNAPAGGGGPGAFRSAHVAGHNEDIDQWHRPGTLGSKNPAPLLAQSSTAKTVGDAGPSAAAPPDLHSHAVEMYAPGESPTYDALSRDVGGLGIKYKIATLDREKAIAQYDPETNTLKIDREEYKNYASGKDKESLRRDFVHELVHARQWKQLLQATADPTERKKLLDKETLSKSEAQYVQFRWARELEAERTAWTVSIESTNAFARSSSGRSTGMSEITMSLADTELEEFTRDSQRAYEDEFRKTYRRAQLAARATQPQAPHR